MEKSIVIIILFLIISCTGNNKSDLKKDLGFNFEGKLKKIHSEFVDTPYGYTIDGGRYTVYKCEQCNLSKEILLSHKFKLEKFDEKDFYNLFKNNPYSIKSGYNIFIWEDNNYTVEIWINEHMDTIIYKKIFM